MKPRASLLFTLHSFGWLLRGGSGPSACIWQRRDPLRLQQARPCANAGITVLFLSSLGATYLLQHLRLDMTPPTIISPSYTPRLQC